MMGFIASAYDHNYISDWWRLCDKLSVDQATLLIVGGDPEEFGFRGNKKPPGYKPVRTALEHALAAKKVEGYIVEDFEGYQPRLDEHLSTVDVESLKSWLREKGVTSGYFFADSSFNTPGYLTESHPRYSPRLAAAIKAWEAMEDAELYSGRAPKTAMEEWLRARYKELRLVHEKDDPQGRFRAGEMNKSAITEAAKIANWLTEGGAPRTPEATHPRDQANPPTPISGQRVIVQKPANQPDDDFDDSIPF